LRRPVRRRCRQADDQGAEGAAGRARPPPGLRGPGRHAARADRRCRQGARRRRRPAGDGRFDRRAGARPGGRPRRVRRPVRRLRRPGGARGGEGDVLRMSTVLATYNVKGGVGKTSAAVNLARLAADEGARTLLWDLDPQGASTYLFRVKPKVKGGGKKLV